MKAMSIATASDFEVVPAPARPRVTPPPVEAHVNKIPVLWSIARHYRRNYQIRLRPVNWRGWGFRTWRLDRYLANNPTISPNFSDDSGRG